MYCTMIRLWKLLLEMQTKQLIYLMGCDGVREVVEIDRDGRGYREFLYPKAALSSL